MPRRTINQLIIQSIYQSIYNHDLDWFCYLLDMFIDSRQMVPVFGEVRYTPQGHPLLPYVTTESKPVLGPRGAENLNADHVTGASCRWVSQNAGTQISITGKILESIGGIACMYFTM